MTVKWKKGIDKLNIENQEEVKDKDEVINRQYSKVERQSGYGRFQTYANFLKGEEKEQYETYQENKRKKIEERMKNVKAALDLERAQ